MKATGQTCFLLMLSSGLVANAVRTLKGGKRTIVGLDMALSASCGYSVDRFGVTFGARGSFASYDSHMATLQKRSPYMACVRASLSQLRACLRNSKLSCVVFPSQLIQTTIDALRFPADENYFGYHNYHEGSSAAAAATASGEDSSAAASAASSGAFTPFCTISAVHQCKLFG